MNNDYRTQIQIIRADMVHGRITIDEAKKLVAPILKEMNAKGEAIAKEHGMRYTKLTFNYVMR